MPLLRELAWMVLMAVPTAAIAQQCMPVIDMHVHFYSAGEYWGPAPSPSDRTMSPASVEQHTQQTLGALEQSHVALSLASAPLDWNNPAAERLWHSLQAEHPDELDLGAVQRAVAEGKIRAFGELGGQYQGIPPTHPGWTPFYALAEEHGLPVAIHTGGGPAGVVLRGRPKFRYEFGNPLLLQDVLIAHPKMKVSMMHAGLDLYREEALAMMHMYPQLYADIGAATWVRPFMQAAMRRFVEEALGRGYGDRILFGSDQMVWPSAIPTAVKTIADATWLDPAQKRAILFDNAATFLGLDEAQRRVLENRACGVPADADQVPRRTGSEPAPSNRRNP